MKEHICEKCEHEKECLNMVCFYELLEKEEGKIRVDERIKVLEILKKEMPHDICDGNEAIEEIERILNSHK